MHYTYSGKTLVADDGRAYRFSVELGDRVGVSSDGFLFTRRHPGHGYRGNQRGSDCRGNGYYGVTCLGHSVYVHQLVYELYSGRVPDGFEIDHSDGDRHNNSIENLRAVTKSGNMRNPVTRRRNLRQLGKVRWKARASRIRKVAATGSDGTERVFHSVAEASSATGACGSDIARAATGRRRTAAGFEWRYCK